MRAALLATATARASEIEAVHPSHRRSATNLVHYVELRNHDIRDLQSRLGALGLSSLGRSEPSVLATIEAVLALLSTLTERAPIIPAAGVSLTEGYVILANNADRLLGPSPPTRSTRITVTLPSAAADDPHLVAGLIDGGIDVARINCAHDEAEDWAEMITLIRACDPTADPQRRIAMDLGGPKLRTGPLAPGPRAVRIGPKRDHLGHVRIPARVWLTAAGFRIDDIDRSARSLNPAAPTPGGSVHPIGCRLGELFEQARAGERVWLDDGKIGGTIHRVTDDEIELTVTSVRPGGTNLRAGKGINVPDTDLQLDVLTAKDREDLRFVARHADIVSLSFVRRPNDVATLQHELDQLDAGNVGIVLKIENSAAFESLPELLLTAMRSEKIGVMIARGDLAVEVGFERLAEVQEEIMWACEAAHVPVIWATQVLDTLARTGQPSRAEITDAAMSERAECVMLNKGPSLKR